MRRSIADPAWTTLAAAWVTREGEIDVSMDENKAVVRRYLTGMHAAPPDLTVFDELLAPTFLGDRAASKALAAALDSAIREQIFEMVQLSGHRP
jgi:uncharacterized membrane protein